MRSISIAAAILTSCGGIEGALWHPPPRRASSRGPLNADCVDAIATLHGKLMIHMLQLLVPLIQF